MVYTVHISDHASRACSEHGESKCFELGEFWYVQRSIATTQAIYALSVRWCSPSRKWKFIFRRAFVHLLLYDGFRQDVGKHIASVDLLQPKVALGNAVLYPMVFEYPRAWPCLVLCENPLLSCTCVHETSLSGCKPQSLAVELLQQIAGTAHKSVILTLSRRKTNNSFVL